jgi:hypothetical protein
LAKGALWLTQARQLRMTLIYIIAGEASGDVLGARLIAALQGAP